MTATNKITDRVEGSELVGEDGQGEKVDLSMDIKQFWAYRSYLISKKVEK